MRTKALVCLRNELNSSDLIRELKRRGHWYDEWEALTCLRAKGCPVRLLDELEDWLNVPIVDAEKLRRYKERCAGL